MVSYSRIEKNGKAMCGLQAAGLAVEVVHKLVCSRVKSCSEVCLEDAAQVQLSGKDLKVNGRKQASFELPLQVPEQTLAIKAFLEQRQLLARLGINVYTADARKRGGRGKSHDLVADFSYKPFPVTGFLRHLA